MEKILLGLAMLAIIPSFAVDTKGQPIDKSKKKDVYADTGGMKLPQDKKSELSSVFYGGLCMRMPMTYPASYDDQGGNGQQLPRPRKVVAY